VGDSWCGMSPCVCGVSRSSLVVKMREGVSFLQVGQSQPRSVRADKQLIAGGQRSGQLVRGWEATLVLKSGEWRGGRRVFREQTAPVEGDAVPYECGERKKGLKGYCWLLTVNTLLKFQRGSLGLNNTTPLSSHVFTFALLQTRSSAQRPPFHTLILPQPYETLHVTDCRSQLCHITFYAHSHSLSQACISQTLSRTSLSLRHCSCQVHLHVLVAEHIPSVLIHLSIIAVRVLRSVHIIATPVSLFE
jgi:hypothetical protein